MPTAHDLPQAFRQLRRLGIARICCIGGRSLARQPIDAGLIQDLYLTPLYRTLLKSQLIVRKHGTGADQGVLFEHLKI